MSTDDDITAFIQARLDEDRAAADEMQENASWMSDCGEAHNVSINLRSGWEMDSARVLRGVEAKRSVLAVAHWLEESGRTLAASEVRRALAFEWGTHPDFRPEWTL